MGIFIYGRAARDLKKGQLVNSTDISPTYDPKNDVYDEEGCAIVRDITKDHIVDQFGYFMWTPYPRQIKQLKEDYDTFNGDPKHDAVAIGRRVREREKQRIEARCCPKCYIPIDYIYKYHNLKQLFPCGCQYIDCKEIESIYKERCLDGLQQTKGSETNKETKINVSYDLG